MYIDDNNLQNAIPNYEQKRKKEDEVFLREYLRKHPFMDKVQVPKIFQFFSHESTNLSWDDISTNYFLSDDFIRDFHEKLNWVCVCKHQSISEDIIREFQDEIGWEIICKTQILSEEFIEEFTDKVDWQIISETQCHLSEDFIERHKDKLCWSDIFVHILSEQFLRKHANEITESNSWHIICMWHKLPEQFFRDYADNFDDECWKLLKHQSFLSKQFFIDYKNKFDSLENNEEIKEEEYYHD